MRTEIDWDEWMGLVRRIGKLEGAIEAHALLTQRERRRADEILYGIVREESQDE